MRDRDDRAAYVRSVQAGTNSFAQELLSEIERLQVLVAALQVEKESLSDKAAELQEVFKAKEALRSLLASLEAEMNRLHEQVVALRAENDRHQKEHASLQAQLEGIRTESQKFTSRYAEVEQQNSNLANLYVASYRLHATLDRKEVIDTLQEIIANLVGAEETALLELGGDGRTLELVASFGIAADAFEPITLGHGRIGAAAARGEVFVAEPGVPAATGALEDRLTACVPLILDGRVAGAIAIFRLLPQKPGIEAVDRELFDLLATHAATALYCTTLHAERTAGARGR